MTLDITAFADAFKQYYRPDEVQNMVYMDNPCLAMTPKDTKFGGSNMPVPLIYGNPQGRSALFSVAQTGSLNSSTKLAQFLMTRVQNYSIATISNEAIKASKGDAYAFMEAATTEIDGCINVLKRDHGIAQYHTGFGEIGKTLSHSGSVVTLANIDDITNVEVGQIHNAAASISANDLDGSPDDFTVTAVDRTLGKITYASGNPTDAHYLFNKGDRATLASGIVRRKMAGFADWLPDTAPTSTAFFGQDRSSDVTRLGGVRLDATSLPIEEALIEGATRVAREGFAVTHAFMNFRAYGNLIKALGSKVRYVDAKVGKIGFSGIIVEGPRGQIEVYADQNCPSDHIYLLTLRLWKLASLGELVGVTDEDGNTMLRQSSADGIEVRYASYLNQATGAPGANCAILITP